MALATPAAYLGLASNATTYASPRGTAADPIQAAREEAFGLLRGQLRPNDTDAYLLQLLRQRSAPGAGPYDQRTRDALMAQAADQAAVAERAQLARFSGPGSEAMANEAAARRQAAVQAAGRDINTQANVANYGAQGQAIGQLAGVNQAQQQMRSGSVNDLVSLLSRESRTTQLPSYSTGGDSYRAPEQSHQARMASLGFNQLAGGFAQQPATQRTVTPTAPVYQPQQQQRPQQRYTQMQTGFIPDNTFSFRPR